MFFSLADEVCSEDDLTHVLTHVITHFGVTLVVSGAFLGHLLILMKTRQLQAVIKEVTSASSRLFKDVIRLKSFFET